MNRRNQITLLLCLFLSAAAASCQTTPGIVSASSETPNLYSVALERSIAEMKTEWSRIDDSNNGARVRTNYDHLLVQKDSISDDLPTKVGEQSLEYLDTSSLIEHYKKVRREFAALRVGRMENEGSTLKIVISVDWVSYKHHQLFFGVSDWSEVKFRYDCQESQFIVTSVKLGGI